MRPLAAFASEVERITRQRDGRIDLYGTGTPRLRLFYPTFGVYKYMCPGCHGDLLGHENLSLPEKTADYG